MKNCCLLIALLTTISLRAQTAINIYADTAYAPFLYGLASFDPTDESVLIWTHLSPDSSQQTVVSLVWEVATDSNFTTIVQTGTSSTSAARDWTVVVDVQNLAAYTTYFYRFSTNNNKFTRVGRTRTAPNSSSATADHLRMGVISCSSIYSGFFNAYAQLAARPDLDVLLHLGDYIYDFVDADEEVRVPSPYPSNPVDKAGWRARQKYYLMDPDLRAARQMHPWIVIWDNHDTDYSGSTSQAADSRAAFLEYVPMRLTDTTDNQKIYRKFSYGNLLDVLMVDILLYRNLDNLPSGDPSILGNNQYNWLTNALQNSTAKWKIIANQKMMCGWSVANIPPFFPVTIGNGTVLDTKSWDGYDAARDRLLDFIENNAIDNVVVLSGDAHVSMASDLHQAPTGSAYNSSTGAGSVAVEFLPTSVSRGNFDEMGYPGWIVTAVEGYMATANPNQVYSDITQHGYGIIDMKSDSTVAEFWYCDILSQTNAQTFGQGLLVKDAENHWHRTAMNTPSPAKDYSATLTGIKQLISKAKNIDLTVYPNPTTDFFKLNFSLMEADYIQVELINISNGKTIQTIHQQAYSANRKHEIQINLAQWPAGQYFIHLKGKQLKAGTFIQKINP